jgi:predicted nucleic acid-binding protein
VTGILIDSYAWIEIFKDSPWGRRALTRIENSPSCYVSALTLYELQYRLSDLYGNKKTGSLLATIIAHNDIIPVDMQIAIAAGSVKAGQKRAGSSMGAVDCLILATAREYRLKILTGDRHFAGLDETIDV